MTSRGIEGEGARRTAWGGLPLLYDREMATLCRKEDPTTQGSASCMEWVRRPEPMPSSQSPDAKPKEFDGHVVEAAPRPTRDRPGPKVGPII